MAISNISKNYPFFTAFFNDLEDPDKKETVDNRVKAVFDEYAEYRHGWQHLTPENLTKFIRLAKMQLPDIGDASSLDSFVTMYFSLVNRSDRHFDLLFGEESIVRDKLTSGAEEYTESEVSTILHSQGSVTLQSILDSTHYTTFNRRLLYTTISLLQEQGLDNKAIDLVMKTSLNLMNQDVYYERVISSYGALVYQLVILDIVKNMRAKKLDNSIMPVLEAIELISRTDMSILDTFYKMLDTHIVKDPELIGSVARNAVRFSWEENLSSRFAWFAQFGDYGAEVIMQKYWQEMEAFKRGTGPHPMFSEIHDEDYGTVLMNKNFAFSLVDSALYNIEEEKLRPSARDLDAMFSIVREFVDKKKYRQGRYYAFIAPVAASRGIDLRKLAEVFEFLDGIYFPFFHEQLRHDLWDIRDLINSDLDIKAKCSVLESYFVDKRLHNKVNLPSEYSEKGFKKYSPAAQHDIALVREYIAVLKRDFSTREGLENGKSLARQIKEVIESGLEIEWLHNFTEAVDKKLPDEEHYIEHIATFKEILNQLFQPARQGQSYDLEAAQQRVTAKVCDAIRILNGIGESSISQLSDELSPREITKLIAGLTDGIKTKYSLGDEAANIPQVYTVPERYRLLHTPVYSEPERVMIRDMIRSDLGIRRIQKRFPLGQMFYDVHVSPIDAKINAVIAVYNLAVALITRDDSKKRNSMSCFNASAILVARGYIDVQEGGTRRLYSIVRDELSVLEQFNEQRLSPAAKYEDAKQSALAILQKLRENYLRNEKPKQAAERLEELVSAAEKLLNNTLEFDHLQFRLQRGNVDDIQSRGRITSCALKPFNRTSIGSVLYGIEEQIGLLHIVPKLRGNAHYPIGAAICVNCDGEEGSWLAVDSVEGGDNLKLVKPKLWQAYTLQAICDLAKMQGHNYVMVNTQLPPANPTAEQFVYYVLSLGLESRQVHLRMKGRPKIIEYGHGAHMLDMFTDGYSTFNPPSGTVTGRVIDLSKPYNFIKNARQLVMAEEKPVLAGK